MNSRAVLGEYQPGSGTGNNRSNAGDPIPDYYPPVIDEAKYYLAQRIRESRRRTKGSKQSKNFNFYQGVGKCYICKQPLHFISKGTAPKNHTYLLCAGARKRLCENKYIRLDAAEQMFGELLSKIDAASVLVHDPSADLAREQAELKARITEEQGHLTRLIDVLKTVTSRTITDEIVRREMAVDEMTNRIEEISSEIASFTITNKANFLKSLDLVSYEGRHRAITLLKELNITICILAGTPIKYFVYQGDTPLFNLVQQEDGGARFYPGNSKISNAIQQQEVTWKPLINVDENDLGDEEFINEGYFTHED